MDLESYAWKNNNLPKETEENWGYANVPYRRNGTCMMILPAFDNKVYQGKGNYFDPEFL